MTAVADTGAEADASARVSASAVAGMEAVTETETQAQAHTHTRGHSFFREVVRREIDVFLETDTLHSMMHDDDMTVETLLMAQRSLDQLPNVAHETTSLDLLCPPDVVTPGQLAAALEDELRSVLGLRKTGALMFTNAWDARRKTGVTGSGDGDGTQVGTSAVEGSSNHTYPCWIVVSTESRHVELATIDMGAEPNFTRPDKAPDSDVAAGTGVDGAKFVTNAKAKGTEPDASADADKSPLAPTASDRDRDRDRAAAVQAQEPAPLEPAVAVAEAEGTAISCRVLSLGLNIAVRIMEAPAGLDIAAYQREVTAFLVARVHWIAHVVNQKVLLGQLHDQRLANDMLVPRDILVPRDTFGGGGAPGDTMGTGEHDKAASTAGAAGAGSGAGAATSGDAAGDAGGGAWPTDEAATSSKAAPLTAVWTVAHFHRNCFSCPLQGLVSCPLHSSVLFNLKDEQLLHTLEDAALRSFRIDNRARVFVAKGQGEFFGDFYYMHLGVSTDNVGVRRVTLYLYGTQAVPDKMASELERLLSGKIVATSARYLATALQNKPVLSRDVRTFFVPDAQWRSGAGGEPSQASDASEGNGGDSTTGDYVSVTVADTHSATDSQTPGATSLGALGDPDAKTSVSLDLPAYVTDPVHLVCLWRQLLMSSQVLSRLTLTGENDGEDEEDDMRTAEDAGAGSRAERGGSSGAADITHSGTKGAPTGTPDGGVGGRDDTLLVPPVMHRLVRKGHVAIERDDEESFDEANGLDESWADGRQRSVTYGSRMGLGLKTRAREDGVLIATPSVGDVDGTDDAVPFPAGCFTLLYSNMHLLNQRPQPSEHPLKRTRLKTIGVGLALVELAPCFDTPTLMSGQTSQLVEDARALVADLTAGRCLVPAMPDGKDSSRERDRDRDRAREVDGRSPAAAGVHKLQLRISPTLPMNEEALLEFLLTAFAQALASYAVERLLALVEDGVSTDDSTPGGAETERDSLVQEHPEAPSPVEILGLTREELLRATHDVLSSAVSRAAPVMLEDALATPEHKSVVTTTTQALDLSASGIVHVAGLLPKEEAQALSVALLADVLAMYPELGQKVRTSNVRPVLSSSYDWVEQPPLWFGLDDAATWYSFRLAAVGTYDEEKERDVGASAGEGTDEGADAVLEKEGDTNTNMAAEGKGGVDGTPMRVAHPAELEALEGLVQDAEMDEEALSLLPRKYWRRPVILEVASSPSGVFVFFHNVKPTVVEAVTLACHVRVSSLVRVMQADKDAQMSQLSVLTGVPTRDGTPESGRGSISDATWAHFEALSWVRRSASRLYLFGSSTPQHEGMRQAAPPSHAPPRYRGQYHITNPYPQQQQQTEFGGPGPLSIQSSPLEGVHKPDLRPDGADLHSIPLANLRRGWHFYSQLIPLPRTNKRTSVRQVRGPEAERGASVDMGIGEVGVDDDGSKGGDEGGGGGAAVVGRAEAAAEADHTMRSTVTAEAFWSFIRGLQWSLRGPFGELDDFSCSGSGSGSGDGSGSGNGIGIGNGIGSGSSGFNAGDGALRDVQTLCFEDGVAKTARGPASPTGVDAYPCDMSRVNSGLSGSMAPVPLSRSVTLDTMMSFGLSVERSRTNSMAGDHDGLDAYSDADADGRDGRNPDLVAMLLFPIPCSSVLIACEITPSGNPNANPSVCVVYRAIDLVSVLGVAGSASGINSGLPSVPSLPLGTFATASLAHFRHTPGPNPASAILDHPASVRMRSRIPLQALLMLRQHIRTRETENMEGAGTDALNVLRVLWPELCGPRGATVTSRDIQMLAHAQEEEAPDGFGSGLEVGEGEGIYFSESMLSIPRGELRMAQSSEASSREVSREPPTPEEIIHAFVSGSINKHICALRSDTTGGGVLSCHFVINYTDGAHDGATSGTGEPPVPPLEGLAFLYIDDALPEGLFSVYTVAWQASTASALSVSLADGAGAETTPVVIRSVPNVETAFDHVRAAMRSFLVNALHAVEIEKAWAIVYQGEAFLPNSPMGGPPSALGVDNDLLSDENFVTLVENSPSMELAFLDFLRPALVALRAEMTEKEAADEATAEAGIAEADVEVNKDRVMTAVVAAAAAAEERGEWGGVPDAAAASPTSAVVAAPTPKPSPSSASSSTTQTTETAVIVSAAAATAAAHSDDAIYKREHGDNERGSVKQKLDGTDTEGSALEEPVDQQNQQQNQQQLEKTKEDGEGLEKASDDEAAAEHDATGGTKDGDVSDDKEKGEAMERDVKAKAKGKGRANEGRDSRELSPLKYLCRQLRRAIGTNGRVFYFSSAKARLTDSATSTTGTKGSHDHIVIAGAKGRVKHAVHLDIWDGDATVRLIGNFQGQPGKDQDAGAHADLVPQVSFVQTTVAAVLYALNCC